MKRKDWISLIAMLIIVFIALMGCQFKANGDWLKAAIDLLFVLIPMALFFVIAVVARNRKGGYIKFWRGLSYVLFGFTVLCLLWMSRPVMHYFNVMANKQIVTENVQSILGSCEKMFQKYESEVGSRIITYIEDIKSAKEGNTKKLRVLRNFDPTMTDYDKLVNDWQIAMFTNYEENKKQFEEQRQSFEKALILDFNPFKAAGQFDQLVTQYDSYFKALSKDYSNLTPFEKDERKNIVFESEDIDKVKKEVTSIFAEYAFNFLVFIMYLILAFLACSSYVFFRDETMGKFSKRGTYADVYQKGFQLHK